MELKNSGQRVTSLKILTCLSVYKLLDFLLDLPLMVSPHVLVSMRSSRCSQPIDKGEFKEGVSLTAFDELLRWEKYSYGCSELVISSSLLPTTLSNLPQIFHPVHQWIYRGPFTPLFIRFLGSNMKISAKFTILSYIGTYYAIAASLPLCVANYFLTGWFADTLDHAYMPSWNMLCGTLFIFLAVSPLAFAWYRHRLGHKNFFWAVLEAFTWVPFFSMLLLPTLEHSCRPILSLHIDLAPSPLLLTIWQWFFLVVYPGTSPTRSWHTCSVYRSNGRPRLRNSKAAEYLLA